MLYQSLGNKHIWLRHSTDARWMVSNTAQKDENLLQGYCYCDGYGYPDPSHAERWYVLGRKGMFRSQRLMRNASMTRGQLQRKYEKDEMNWQSSGETLPNTLKIQGATGLMAHKINGIYQSENAPGRLKFYRRCTSSTLADYTKLVLNSSGCWLVLGGDIIMAYSGVPCMADPWLAPCAPLANPMCSPG